jgi:hypothetical protein
MAKNQRLDLNKLLPSSIQNETLSSLVDNLLNSFLSEEKSISLNGKIGRYNTGDLVVPAENLDRKINAIIPAIYFKTGSEENIFTFDDLINKLKVLGVDTKNLRHLLQEQSFNFSPPINYDKFINYSSYYWVGPAADSGLNAALFKNWNTSVDPEYYVIQKPISGSENSWQISNRWVHEGDFSLYPAYNFSKCIKATRPIIEYSRNVELDYYFVADDGTIKNGKTKFNQIPQFRLYRYDGTFSGKTGGVFYYEEDGTADIDPVLKRKIRKNDSGDYVFGLGMIDEQGRQLYFKDTNNTLTIIADDSIKSVWHAGVSAPAASSVVFNGNNLSKASLTIDEISATADTQDWKVIAVSKNELNVIGSRSGHVGVAIAGEIFRCDDVEFTVSFSEAVPLSEREFTPGEGFSFTINALASPRYVKQLTNDEIVNYPGGAAADETNEGTWLTPARMFQNLSREARTEFSFADLVPHMMSVMKSQDGFLGSAYGTNNSRQKIHNSTFNFGLGGKIKDFSSNFPLLVSMLVQRDISPLATIEFAEKQYALALSSIDQFLFNEFAKSFAAKPWIVNNRNNSSDPGDVNPSRPCIQGLLSELEQLRAQDANLRSLFSDSTALVKNWPATLPMLGLLSRVPPSVPSQIGAVDYETFDFELGIDVIKHHDGHTSAAVKQDEDVDLDLVRTSVQRSDGTSSAGVIAAVAPAKPYARQLWFDTSTRILKYFDADFDISEAPPAFTGGIWYNRSTGQISKYNSAAAAWQVDSSITVQSRWKALDFAAIRNCLVGAVEQKLFDSVSPFFDDTLNFDITQALYSVHAEGELARFSSKYNYDTFAPDYSSSDAFTWNYSQAAAVTPLTTVPARWFDVYKQYFDRAPNVISTCRPNLEPWKLLGNITKPTNWDSLYKAQFSLLEIDPSQMPSIAPVKLVCTVNIPVEGAQSIDGVDTTNGDRVLLTGQTNEAENGIYVVASGAWVLQSELTSDVVIPVTGGTEYVNSTWIYKGSQLGQLRLWSNDMWQTIKDQRPTIKLCVNVRTDELLPPYVSSTKFASDEALFTAIPEGINGAYQFGDNGPVEIVWKKSLEFFYSLARNSFRDYPLEFIDKSWGYSYVSSSSDSARVERNLLNYLPSSNFLLHGEKLKVVNQLSADDIRDRISSTITPPSGVVTILTFDVMHVSDDKTLLTLKQNGVLVKGANDRPILIEEGITTSLVDPSIISTMPSVKIDDLGIPFELGDKIEVKFTVDGEETYSYIPSTTKKFVGLGQWFTNVLRFNYIDKDVSSAAVAYRGWTTKLSHRTGSLIRPDSMSISIGGTVIPTTSFRTALKKSFQTASKWLTALRVQLVDMGPAYNVSNPAEKYIAKNSGDLLVPAADASTWVFRIEGYAAQNPFISYYEYDESSYATFTALGGEVTPLSWKRYEKKSSLATATLPLIVTGLQNTLDIINGYVDKLLEDGWTYSAGESSLIDEQTGRNLDWQLEVEKFINTVYSGMSAGEAYILNPFMDRVVLSTPVGLMSQYSESNFIDIYSTQAAFDVIGNRIALNKLTVTRTDDKTVTTSSTPMFSLHAFTDEFEHIVLFNDQYSDEDGTTKIYDQFLGLHAESANLNYVRHDSLSKKPSFSGFFINGDMMSRNIVSSIDNMANFYNPATTFAEKETSEHALALLGYNKKPYFNDLRLTDNSQFNFWRGLIQAKGTNMSVDAILNYKAFEDASVDEFWAYKLAEFGDSRENSLPEIKINPNDALQTFTKIQFFDEDDQLYSALTSYIQVEKNDDSRWVTIDDLGKGLRFEAEQIEEIVTVDSSESFPLYIKLKNIYHNGDAASPTITGAPGATMANANTIRVTRGGTYKVSGFTWLNPTKFSPIKLFDYKDNSLIKEIGLWHPAAGIHAYEPLQTINIISSQNPAFHSYSTETNNNPNKRALKPWAQNEVGTVWWNTENLQYVPYYDATIFENRQAREGLWGTLAGWASVDLYQWTESSVHPSEYDALAAEQEGNSEIDARIRAAGKVAIKKYYSRNRTLSVRPIAWSQLGSANGDGHPAFGPARFNKVFVAANSIFSDSGRLADCGITAGKSFGAWKSSKPYGEVTVGTDIRYNVGSLSALNDPDINPSGFITDITVTPLNSSLFGVKIGAIKLKTFIDRRADTIIGTEGNPEPVVVEKIYFRLMDSAGAYQDIEIEDWFSNDYSINNSRSFEFDNFGLSVEVIRSIDAPELLTAQQIADGISTNEHDVYIREGVDFTEIIALPDDIFINDETDPDYALTEYGWKSWDVPTQDDLDNDLVTAPRKWKPYFGDSTSATITPSIIKSIKSGEGRLILIDGTVASRYVLSWGSWTESKRIISESITDTAGGIAFAVLNEDITASRAAVYVNGFALPSSDYSISGSGLTINSVVRAGSTVTFVYDRYIPTEDELAFDPDVSDNVSVLTQYKLDYEYTQLDDVDDNGNVIGKKYYFWVRDKTIPQNNKSMSLVSATQLLTNGDSQFALFSRAVIQNQNVYFDSCAIYGLNLLVTKNDSYKLRFIRNFVLRDDPEEINLKNVHSEWTLMRRGQSYRIPKKLWDLITDAASGEDIGGNPLPSAIRVDYDNRNNTRTRYGFKQGQIFADSGAVRESITDTILNTSLTISVGSRKIINYIRSSALDFDNSDSWFSSPTVSRSTMDAIWRDASARQINEIFFNVLEVALAHNYEFTDIIKTSMFALNVTRKIDDTNQRYVQNEIF